MTTLLLSPSHGFGGGIERVVDAIESAWPSPTRRLDLYDARRDAKSRGNWKAKTRFLARSVSAALTTRPGKIVCLHIGLLPVAYFVGALTKAPVTLVAYGTEVWAPMSPVRRRLVRRCSRLLAISHFTAQWLATRACLSRERIELLSLAISPALAEAAATTPPATREPVVITVSRVMRQHRYKGHHAIAAAWPRVLRDRPDARWIVVGNGDDLSYLKDRCSQLGIDSSVEWLIGISDDALAEAYVRAAALVLPSVADVHSDPPTGEGFGLVYAEAGAFAVPSIAAEVGGGASEILEHGVTGLTVNPSDAAGIAGAILSLLNDEALRQRLGEAARTKVFREHLPEQFARRVEEIGTR
jgi:phosphatidyl-myo-inositol dimannoside synthase